MPHDTISLFRCTGGKLAFAGRMSNGISAGVAAEATTAVVEVINERSPFLWSILDDFQSLFARFKKQKIIERTKQ